MDSIEKFWAWFHEWSQRFVMDPESPSLIHELDAEVASLGPIAWEVGPGRNGAWRLTLSPDGELSLLALTSDVISRAPAIGGWEFASSRQPRDWNLIFSLLEESGNKLEIDARPWQYVLWRFPDGMCEIKIAQTGVPLLTEENRYRAALIALDGLLGEECRLRVLSAVEVVDVLSEDEQKRATPIALLPQHLQSS